MAWSLWRGTMAWSHFLGPPCVVGAQSQFPHVSPKGSAAPLITCSLQGDSVAPNRQLLEGARALVESRHHPRAHLLQAVTFLFRHVRVDSVFIEILVLYVGLCYGGVLGYSPVLCHWPAALLRLAVCPFPLA